MSLKDIKYILGIDFGAISSGVSIAHIDHPSIKFTVNEWEDDKSKSIGPKQFLTSILYKSNGEIQCGLPNTANDKASRHKEDIYINNIKEYILNIDQANEELGKKKQGLTIQKVVTDYLKIFHDLAIDRLRAHEEFKTSENFESDFNLKNIRYCLTCPSTQNEFMTERFIEAGIVEEQDLEYRLVFVTEAEAAAYHNISLDRLKTKMVHDQTYLVCEIGHSAFGMSKIQTDTTEYLSAVSLISEEPGKGSISLEKNFIKFLAEKRSNYKLSQTIVDDLVQRFVDDVKFSFGMPQEEIIEDDNGYTENANENEDESEKDDDNDEDIDDDEDDDVDDDFDDDDDDDYDEDDEDDEGNDDDEEEEALVFTKREKVIPKNDISDQVDDLEIGTEQEADTVALSTPDVNGKQLSISYRDLYENVFLPYINYIIDYILKVDKQIEGETNSESKIFLSGRYSSDGQFFDKISAAKDGKLQHFLTFIDETSIDVTSLGAVSFGLRLYDLQTPFFMSSDSSIKSGLASELDSSISDLKGIDFVVGIDFGTTFTGCSYADCRETNKAIKTIKTGWPGGNAVAFGKTPTLIMYDKKMRTKYWGQEAKSQVEYHSDLSLLGNFKLFLSPKCVEDYYGVNNKDIQELREKNNYLNRVENEKIVRKNQSKKYATYQIKKKHTDTSVDAIDVIADYLKAVKDHVIKNISDSENKKGNFLKRTFKSKEFKFRFVITVPAMWSISARESMAEAAIQATIIKRNELNTLRIISEPEAAALFCESKYKDLILDPENPEAGSNFVVCDAGGGTVDLVTFALRFENREPAIHQIGDGSGDTCGSSYVDSNFKKYLEDFYKNIGLDIDFINTNFNRVMDDFIRIKCNFKSNPDKDSYHLIKLPAERTIPDFKRSPKNERYILTDRNTVLKIRHSDMKKEIFDPIIDRILKLIEEQLEQANAGDKAGKKIEIKTILLIGGFSRNEYLQQRVKEHFHGICNVGIPEEGIAAISHGAVSYALNPRMISLKSAGQSLALEVCAPFDKSKNDPLVKRVCDSSGKEFAKNRLEYFVKKSQLLDKGGREVYVKRVNVEYPKSALIAIFSYDYKEEDKPDNWRYVSRMHAKIMEETIELPQIEGIPKGKLIAFDVCLKMDHIGVTVTIKCLDRTINNVYRRTKGQENGWVITRKCSLVVFRDKKPLLQYSLVGSRFVFGST